SLSLTHPAGPTQTVEPPPLLLDAAAAPPSPCPEPTTTLPPQATQRSASAVEIPRRMEGDAGVGNVMARSIVPAPSEPRTLVCALAARRRAGAHGVDLAVRLPGGFPLAWSMPAKGDRLPAPAQAGVQRSGSETTPCVIKLEVHVQVLRESSGVGRTPGRGAC